MMGDVIETGPGKPVLHVRAVGTAPIDWVEVRNGPEVMRTLRPFGRADLGRRIKVEWSGAEARGRNRMATWDGSLEIKGNSIRKCTSVNFWNPDRQVTRDGPNRLVWQSVTTGGSAGVIFDLERPYAGALRIDTVQRRATCAVRSIGLAPRTWKAGGLDKQIRVYRLPDPPRPTEYDLSLPLTDLVAGDNPIYVCVGQEDGHRAWSSPIYCCSS